MLSYKVSYVSNSFFNFNRHEHPKFTSKKLIAKDWMEEKKNHSSHNIDIDIWFTTSATELRL